MLLLGNLLDYAELVKLLDERYIILAKHPDLPIGILNYSNSCMFDNFWPDTVQKCRGLVVELDSAGNLMPESTIIARPFHKFFGLNHQGQPDYAAENLPNVVPTVTEKMDGWFGIMWEYKGQYGVASRGSFVSEGAVYATQKIQKLVKYGAVEEFPKGYSPIFEIIFPAGRIVVQYPFDGLVLLGCVNNETGEELPYDDLQAVWAKIAGYSADNRPWIRLVKAHRMTLTECTNYENQLHSLINTVKRTKVTPADYDPGKPLLPYKNMEGFVLSYARPGTWPIKVKVKLEEYKKLHKLITGVTPQQIWSLLKDPIGEFYDAKVIPTHFKTWAEDWRKTLLGQFDEILSKAHYWRDEMSAAYEADKPRKSIVAELDRTAPSVRSVVMNLLDGKIEAAYKEIWTSIRPVGIESETYYKDGANE